MRSQPKSYNNSNKDGSEFFYMWAWTYQEIWVVLHVINVEMFDDGTTFYRFKCTGGAPRYVSIALIKELVIDMQTHGNNLYSRKVSEVLNGSPGIKFKERGDKFQHSIFKFVVIKFFITFKNK